MALDVSISRHKVFSVAEGQFEMNLSLLMTDEIKYYMYH